MMSEPRRSRMRRARRAAVRCGHLLGRFRSGKDTDGKPDPWCYGAECRFCGALVIVFSDDRIDPFVWVDGESRGRYEPGRCWVVCGPAVSNQCPGPRPRIAK